MAGEWFSRPITGRQKGAIFMTAALLIAALAGASAFAPGVLAGDNSKSSGTDKGSTPTDGTPTQDNDVVDVDGNNNTVNINVNTGEGTDGQDGQDGTDTVSNEQIVTVVNDLDNSNENINDIDNINSFDAELLNDFLDIILGDQINDGDDVTDGDGDDVSIVRSCEAALVQADVPNATVEVDVLDVTNNTTATVDAGPVDGTTTVSIDELDLTGTGVNADTSVITEVRVVDEDDNVVAVDIASTQELIDCVLASDIDLADIDPDLTAQLGLTDGATDFPALDGTLNDTQLTALDGALNDTELATFDAALEAGTVNDTQVSALADGLISGEITGAEASAAVTSGDIDAALTDLLTSAGLLSMGAPSAMVLA